MTKSSVLITGASTGIGAVYAERFARRGHDLVLVARDKTKLDLLAERLRQENAISVDVLPADLTQSRDLATVEARLRDDLRIGVLINNAGIAQSGSFAEQTPDSIERLIALNITALTRLASAVTPDSYKRVKDRSSTSAPSLAWLLNSPCRFMAQPKPLSFSCLRE